MGLVAPASGAGPAGADDAFPGVVPGKGFPGVVLKKRFDITGNFRK